MASLKLSSFAVCLALGTATIAGSASAGVLLTENFSGATPGTYGGGAIPGTQFTVTAANIDIVGQLNGNFFVCDADPSGNCLDLVGNSGGGAIASAATFDLLASEIYTVSFGSVLQGFAPGSTASTTFRVSLGSLFQDVTILGGVSNTTSLQFAPVSNEADARLGFATLLAPDTVHGAVLDNISLSSAAAAVPEPATWAVMILGFGGVGASLRRRRGVAAA